MLEHTDNILSRAVWANSDMYMYTVMYMASTVGS